jgi:hypothetical protein
MIDFLRIFCYIQITNLVILKIYLSNLLLSEHELL